MEQIFFQIASILALTAFVAWFMHWLKQPLIVAYILAGILAGPIAFNIIRADEEIFHVFSKFGIILLLYIVGLSLNFSYIQKIGKAALVTGVGQVVFTAGIGFFIMRGLGFDIDSSIYLAVAITFSSTIIIIKLLTDKKHIDYLYGRYTIGLMLVQDVIAIVLMILLTSYGNNLGFVSSIAPLVVKGLMFFALVFILSKYILPTILRNVSRSTEFLFLFAVSWCFAITFIAHWLGFSMEIGAVLAGIAIGSSVYQSEISARIKPLRDFFLIIFFIILGSEMTIGSAREVLIPGVVISLFILIGNPFILYVLYRVLKFTRRNSFFAGVTAAQVSEFGFVLLVLGREMGVVNSFEINVFTIVALLTIFSSSYIVMNSEGIFSFLEPVLNLFGKEKRIQREPKKPSFDVWVIGYHRIGWKIIEELKQSNDKSFAVIDFNPKIVDVLEKDGIPAFFGDINDIELLSEFAIEKSLMVISTIPEADDNLVLVKYIRERSQKPMIVVNCTDMKRRNALYEAGADYVLTPHLLGGDALAKMANKVLKREELKKMKEKQDKEIATGLPVYNI
jgi:Kef-type K+ transport system membrane component KefB